jgi:hypothetical protein
MKLISHVYSKCHPCAVRRRAAHRRHPQAPRPRTAAAVQPPSPAAAADAPLPALPCITYVTHACVVVQCVYRHAENTKNKKTRVTLIEDLCKSQVLEFIFPLIFRAFMEDRQTIVTLSLVLGSNPPTACTLIPQNSTHHLINIVPFATPPAPAAKGYRMCTTATHWSASTLYVPQASSLTPAETGSWHVVTRRLVTGSWHVTTRRSVPGS